MKIDKKLKDIVLNIVASGVMTAALQLIVYPLLGRRFSAADYGEILTIMGICNIVSSTFGNGLNSTRLVRNTEYTSRGLVGDFNRISLFSLSAVFTVGAAAAQIISHCLPVSILVGATAALAVVKAYYSVGFRLRLDYRQILICNLASAVGYVFGALTVRAGAPWPVAFLTGEALGAAYALFFSRLLEEGSKQTILFRNTLKTYLLLLSGILISSIATYMDRLFLHPMMGSSAVSVYSVAAVVGKCVSIVMLPISGVMLSYFAQDSYVMTRSRFFRQGAAMTALAALAILLLAPVSPLITRFLYPTIYDAARDFIFIANTAAVISVLSNMLAPAILKFVEPYWQILIAAVYCGVYFLLGILFIRFGGLRGFCWSALLANISRCAFLLMLGLRIRKTTETVSDQNIHPALSEDSP